jgi:hypothetical protein
VSKVRTDPVAAACGLPAGSRKSPDRTRPSDEPEPPCKSGQLKKDLGLEVSSARHAARLIIFEVMRSFFIIAKPNEDVPINALIFYLSRSSTDPTSLLPNSTAPSLEQEKAEGGSPRRAVFGGLRQSSRGDERDGRPSLCGQQMSLGRRRINGDRGSRRHRRQALRVSEWEGANGASGKRRDIDPG